MSGCVEFSHLIKWQIPFTRKVPSQYCVCVHSVQQYSTPRPRDGRFHYEASD